jgi:hypothetical protein
MRTDVGAASRGGAAELVHGVHVADLEGHRASGRYNGRLPGDIFATAVGAGLRLRYGSWRRIGLFGLFGGRVLCL